LVRNGPNPVLPDPTSHVFAGDGMLHAFHLENGRVSYRNRWVRTASYEYARRTGQNLFLSAFSSEMRDPSVKDDGVANTNIVRHAGRLLALEEQHLPIRIRLPDLATEGPDDFSGGLKGAFTAHPKTDPVTGEMIFFGYGVPELLSAGMSYGTISREGSVTRLEHFDAPYASMVHDFAVTEHHVVFPITPLTASQKRAEAGLPPYAWEPEVGARVGILSRAAGVSSLTWCEIPVCYVFHVMNAFEVNNQLCLDVMRFDRAPLFPHADGSPVIGPPNSAHLTRWTFSLGESPRLVSQTPLSDAIGEFPRFDERRAGLTYRHGWHASHTPGADGKLRIQSSIVHVDTAQQRTTRYTFPDLDRVSEPVFVPRSAQADEGDGWILATVWRSGTGKSDLAIFEAGDLEAGPFCTASLPHRVPDGFHGNWFGQ
jgi:carotenoid cleavage dioxygenase